jgi:hypothetical protein
VWHCDWIQDQEEKPKIFMIGASLNCRGVGKKGMTIFLSDFIREQHLDFIGLQETIKKNYSSSFFRRIDPGNQFSWKWIPSVGRSGGILSGLRNSRFDILDIVMGRFYISVTLQDLKLQKKWKLVLVYGAAQENDKEEFLVELGDICCNQRLPMFIGGDFNILRFPSEKNKAMRRSKWSDLFNAIINTYELREIEMSGGQFSWSNNQTNPTLKKLDRFLMNSEWESMFPLVTVHKICREVSDHNTIILDTLENREQKSINFKFEKNWLKEDDFLDKVEGICMQKTPWKWCKSN